MFKLQSYIGALFASVNVKLNTKITVTDIYSFIATLKGRIAWLPQQQCNKCCSKLKMLHFNDLLRG